MVFELLSLRLIRETRDYEIIVIYRVSNEGDIPIELVLGYKYVRA